MPDSLLLTFYGDDFTGSADAMEALMRAGVRAALFLDVPAPERLAQFAGVRAVGVAGTARTMTPAAMDAALPPIFEGLRRLSAPITHYKMCSTGDSSPEIGSVGRAIDLGQAVFASPFVPLLVASPRLGRYCAFGTLFARSGPDGEIYRLDCHPTMSAHPITPMREADLRQHFSRQTARSIGLFDVLQYEVAGRDELRARLNRILESGVEIVLFDALVPHHLPPVGALLWHSASRERPLFVVGSSAIENALAEHWLAERLIPPAEPLPHLGPVDQLLVLSGSASPVTERQTRAALEAGFAEVPLRPAEWVHPEASPAAINEAVRAALALLAQGRSVIVHSALGPNDPRIAETAAALARMGHDPATVIEVSGELLGARLGAIGRAILEAYPLRRVVVAGGDTSSYVMRALGVEAIEYKAPLAPATPFCHVHAARPPVDGLELVLKGGQLGPLDLYESALKGQAN